MITVKEIRGVKPEALLSLPVKFDLAFDDGIVLPVYRAETIFTSCFWQILDPYPNVLIRQHHHLSTILKGKPPNANSHLQLCSSLVKSAIEEAPIRDAIGRERLLSRVHATISYANEIGIKMSEEHVMSLDILDFIYAAHYPAIRKLRDEAMEHAFKIPYAYQECIRILETDPYFDRNGLAQAVRAKMVKPNQVVQCILFPGYMAEVDGVKFPDAVWSNYVEGLRTLPDFAKDSRKASKSYYYSESALQDSEYTARKFRLFAMTVERVVPGDCGSTEHVSWLVQGKVTDQMGTTVYGGDLPLMVGKHYLKEDGSYGTIEGDEKHLEGTIIQIRSPLTCRESNPHHVCEKCVGQLAQNISRFANIGHLASVTITKELTQSILSIKHVNTSSTSAAIVLNDYQKKYLNTGTHGVAYYLNGTFRNQSPKLKVSKEEVHSLLDLGHIEELTKISPTQISSVSGIRINHTHNGQTLEVFLPTTAGNKNALLSRELLIYLKNYGWSVDESGLFVFDLKHWNFKDPILITENREESFADLAKQVESTILSSNGANKKGLGLETATFLLQDVFSLMNSKFKVNLLAFEIIIYALMVRSTENYTMARNAPVPAVGQADRITRHRSLGAALAYESMDDTLTNPLSFYKGARPDSPLDVFIAPQDVLENYHPEAFD